jgi:hypothetical protein
VQRIYIDLDTDPFRPRAAITGLQLAEIACVLGAPINVAVIFHRGGTREALAASSTGKLTVKEENALDGDALFIDASMVETDDPDAEGEVYYLFEGILDSDELIAAMPGASGVFAAAACVSWTEPGEDTQKCSDLTVKIDNSSERPADTLPAKAAQCVITNDELRVLCPDGIWRRAILADLAA